MGHAYLRRSILIAGFVLVNQTAFAEVKEIRLPTAEDGEVVYLFDTDAKSPLSAKDDKAKILAVSLTFLAKKPGENLRWAFKYEVKFEDGVIPKSIGVYSENSKPITIDVTDTAPVLKDNIWEATSAPSEVTQNTLKFMTNKESWFLQKKFVITYSDGVERVLHQLAVITNPMRFALLEKVIGKSISEPSKN